MKLIAESGSTKTHWFGSDGVKTITFTTTGFNPVVQNKDQIRSIISNEVSGEVENQSITEIFFYGAGCSTQEYCKVMETSFAEYFPNAHIEIEHDLLAAARGICGNQPGIAAILGTGSNSCVYNGTKITENMPSLGYALGDDGSGAYIGRQLIRDFLYMKMPEDLSKELKERYALNKDVIIDAVYKKPAPNRWLATWAKFAGEHISSGYCYGVVKQAFGDFFENHISHYRKYLYLPVGAVGSIAWHFRDIFTDVCEEHSFQPGRIIQSPFEELVKYHEG